MNAPVKFPVPRFDEASFLQGLEDFPETDIEVLPSIPPGGGVSDPDENNMLCWAFTVLAKRDQSMTDRLEKINGWLQFHYADGKSTEMLDRLQDWADAIHSTIGGSAA